MKNFEKYIDYLTDIDKVACKICKIRKLNCQTLVKRCEEIKVENKKWLLAEYVEPIQLTHDEYVILKNLPSEYKYIVRCEIGDVESYEYKPTKGNHVWFADESIVGELYVFNHLFQFIKWEDEPYEIAKLIADYEKENGNE